jgi:hypothetical protein
MMTSRKPARSLAIGQRANLLQSKLKQQSTWNAVSQEQNSIALMISLIETITF